MTRTPGTATGKAKMTAGRALGIAAAIWTFGSGASQAETLILQCTATSGQFASMSGLFRTAASALFKIEDETVSIWEASQSRWRQHPCVYDEKAGQFCSISPTQMQFKESWSPEPGVTGVTEIVIDRTTGAFDFRYGVYTPGVRPYLREHLARGVCAQAEEPALPATRF
jgi:hypothetical protein